jgi:hypothetical protein
VREVREFSETGAACQERGVALDLVEIRLGGVEYVQNGGSVTRWSGEGAQTIDLGLDVGCEGGRHEGRDLRLAGLVAESPCSLAFAVL